MKRKGTSDLALDVAALVAEAALPLAQLLLRRRLGLQEALHRLHLRRSSACYSRLLLDRIGGRSSGEGRKTPTRKEVAVCSDSAAKWEEAPGLMGLVG